MVPCRTARGAGLPPTGSPILLHNRTLRVSRESGVHCVSRRNGLQSDLLRSAVLDRRRRLPGPERLFFAPAGERPETRVAPRGKARAVCTACPAIAVPPLGPRAPRVRLLGRRVRGGARRRRLPCRHARRPGRPLPQGQRHAGRAPHPPGRLTLSLPTSRDTRLVAVRSCTWVTRCSAGYPPPDARSWPATRSARPLELPRWAAGSSGTGIRSCAIHCSSPVRGLERRRRRGHRCGRLARREVTGRTLRIDRPRRAHRLPVTTPPGGTRRRGCALDHLACARVLLGAVRRPRSCGASSRRAERAVEAVLRHGDVGRHRDRLRDGCHVRRAARGRAPHPPRSRDRHLHRSRAGGRSRPRPVALRGSHRHRRWLHDACREAGMRWCRSGPGTALHRDPAQPARNPRAPGAFRDPVGRDTRARGPRAARRHRRAEVDRAIEDNDEVQTYVHELEARVDMEDAADQGAELGQDEMPSAGELVDEVEQFLREQGDGP